MKTSGPPLPPSTGLSLAGALIIANPSASNELVGKADYRRQLVAQQSARCIHSYVYASAGPGESTTDTVYGGHALIAEYGRILEENERFNTENSWICGDTDLEYLEHQRLNSSAYIQAREIEEQSVRVIGYEGKDPVPEALIRRSLDPHPLCPRLYG